MLHHIDICYIILNVPINLDFNYFYLWLKPIFDTPAAWWVSPNHHGFVVPSMAALRLLVFFWAVGAAEKCDAPVPIRANGTTNSAPLLLQRPGTGLVPKNRTEGHSTSHFVNFRMAETWTSLSKLGEVSLEQFGPHGVHKFFNAALIFDWCLFLLAACVAVVWRSFCSWLTPLASLVSWLGLGGIYASIIFVRMGAHHGSNWLAGKLGVN